MFVHVYTITFSFCMCLSWTLENSLLDEYGKSRRTMLLCVYVLEDHRFISSSIIVLSTQQKRRRRSKRTIVYMIDEYIGQFFQCQSYLDSISRYEIIIFISNGTWTFGCQCGFCDNKMMMMNIIIIIILFIAWIIFIRS